MELFAFTQILKPLESAHVCAFVRVHCAHCTFIVLQQMAGYDSDTSRNLNITILFEALLLRVCVP